MKLFHETEGNTELLKGTYKTDTYVDAFYLFFYFYPIYYWIKNVKHTFILSKYLVIMKNFSCSLSFIKAKIFPQ